MIRVFGAPQDLAALGSMLSDEFADAYRSELGEPADLLEVDQDGFTFLFDFSSGSRTPGGRDTEDRVVGAWGMSRPPPAPRDRSRMRGSPSARRAEDTSKRDRGYLFGHALGGGLDSSDVYRADAGEWGPPVAGAKRAD